MAYDPYFDKVKLLCHFDGSNGDTASVDTSTSPATLTLVNGAALSSTRSKYGATSLFLDGTNDRVTTNRAVAIGTGMFTLEAWVRPTGAQAGRVIGAQNSGAPNAVIVLRVNADGSVEFFMRPSAGGTLFDLSSSAGVVPMNDTAQVALGVTRDAANRVDLWVNNVSVAHGTSTYNPNGNNYEFGSQYGSAEWYKGYIDDVRITEGACRDLSVAQTAAWPDFAATVAGTVRDSSNAPCARTVRLYRRDTGALLGSAVSDATTGAYAINVLTIDEVTVLCLDDASGSLENDLCARVIPGT